MPSPIAHCSLIVIYRSAIEQRISPETPAWRIRLLYLAVLAALVAPDCDIAVGLVMGVGIGRYHNGVTHSFLFAPAFGLIFAIVCRPLMSRGFACLFVIGATAYASHIVLDFLSWHRTGVQLFWPLTGERFASPVSLFLGVRHSVNAPWWVHARMVATEVLFGVGLWLACYCWRARSREKLKDGAVHG